MTIDNEQRDTFSIPNQATQSGSYEDEDEDDTPRRIPIPPRQRSPISSSQHNGRLPTSHPISVTRPPEHSTVAPQRSAWPPLPAAAPLHMREAKRRRVAVPLVITLVLLAILIILGGFLGQHL